MIRSIRSFRWSRAAIAAAVGAALLIGGAQFSAYANDNEEDDLPDTQLLRSILKGLGLRRDGEASIDYRERSPLVLPPGRELPAPGAAANATPNADWPKDPDIQRARQARTTRSKPLPDPDELARPLSPNELNPAGARTRSGSRAGSAPGRTAEDSERPMTPTELGAKNPLSSIWASKEEYTTFTQEPARNSLTQPPMGYRTPSPNQPYGVGKEKWVDKPQDQHMLVR